MLLRFLSLTSYYEGIRQVILYAAIGLLASVLDLVVYAMLVYVFCLHYLVANIVSVLVSIPICFFLNRNVNFMTLNRTLLRFMSFLVVGVLGMLMAGMILYVCIDVYHLGKIISKLLSIVPVSMLQFLLNKYVTFRPIANMPKNVLKSNQFL